MAARNSNRPSSERTASACEQTQPDRMNLLQVYRRNFRTRSILLNGNIGRRSKGAGLACCSTNPMLAHHRHRHRVYPAPPNDVLGYIEKDRHAFYIPVCSCAGATPSGSALAIISGGTGPSQKGAIVSGHRFSPLDRSIHGKIPSGTPFVEASRKGGAGFLDHAVVRLNKLLYPTHSRPIAVPSVLPLTQIHVLKQPRGGTFATKDPMFCYHIIKLQNGSWVRAERSRSFPGLGTCQS